MSNGICVMSTCYLMSQPSAGSPSKNPTVHWPHPPHGCIFQQTKGLWMLWSSKSIVLPGLFLGEKWINVHRVSNATTKQFDLSAFIWRLVLEASQNTWRQPEDRKTRLSAREGGRQRDTDTRAALHQPEQLVPIVVSTLRSEAAQRAREPVGKEVVTWLFPEEKSTRPLTSATTIAVTSKPTLPHAVLQASKDNTKTVWPVSDPLPSSRGRLCETHSIVYWSCFNSLLFRSCIGETRACAIGDPIILYLFLDWGVVWSAELGKNVNTYWRSPTPGTFSLKFANQDKMFSLQMFLSNVQLFIE